MSPPKTAGKTGETGKPSIDAGFRSSGLQKRDREKPGIRGAGVNGSSAEMAALALPERDPPPTKRGRPTGPTKSVQLQIRGWLTLVIYEEMQFAAAARKVTGTKDGNKRLDTYKQRYRDFYDQAFDELVKAKNAQVAEALFPELRTLAKKEAETVAELIDKPGQRTAATSVRDNPNDYAQQLVEVFADSLATMWAKIEQSDTDDSAKDTELILLIRAWKKSCLEVLKSGPAGRI